MFLFQWLSRKSAAKHLVNADSSGLGHVDATLPLGASGRRLARPGAGNAANRKSERLERRELLYTVVREAMTRAGVLSSSFKFKVLSLDSRGRQYLIMMDLARQYVGETARLAEIEGLIAQTAKTRHDILVTSVYWRVNEHVTAGLSNKTEPAPAPVPLSQALPKPVAAPVAAPVKPHFEPLQDDEVAAFKKALASVATPAVSPAHAGEVVRSGRRNPAPVPVFQDTQLVDEGHSPLSGTQYGDLN